MLYYLSVYLHIMLAAFWIGGMLFLPLVVLSGLKNHPDRTAILYQTGLKFRFYGWFALALLLLTGLGNWYSKGWPFEWDFLLHTEAGHILGVKLLLFALLLAISVVHDFFIGGKAIDQMQRQTPSAYRTLARWSGRLNLLLSLTLAFLGVVLSRGGWPS